MGKYNLSVKVCYDLGWEKRFSEFYNELKDFGITCNSDDTISFESNEQLEKVNELIRKHRIQIRLYLVQENNNKNAE